MTNTNNSKIFTQAIAAKARLVSQLAMLDEYLTEGSGTTRIDFIGKRNKILSTQKMSSNWTTSNGQLRVSTIHKQFIHDLTQDDSLPFGTVKVKVKSPFIETRTSFVKTKVDVILPFSYTANA